MTDLEITVLHADSHIAVVNKPGGMLSMPGRGPDKQDCVVSRVRALFPECIEFPTVHRLDMDTSGLLVLGLTRHAQRELSRQFHDRTPSKRYVALLEGRVTRPEGTVDLPMNRDFFDRPRQIYDPIHGRQALTFWRRLGEEGGCTRVEFRPVTGRTHQLRLHAAHALGLAAPIVGDRLYGSGTRPGELRLHAEHLAFDHPVDGKRLAFSVPAHF